MSNYKLMVLVGLIAASGSLFGGKNRWTGEGLAAARAKAAEAGMGKSKKFAAEEREREEQGADSFVPGCGEPLLEGHATGSGEVDSAARGEYAPPAMQEPFTTPADLAGIDFGKRPEPSAPPAEEVMREPRAHEAGDKVHELPRDASPARADYIPGSAEEIGARLREENISRAREAGLDDSEEPSTAASASVVRARSGRHATMAAMPARSGF